MLFKIQSPIIHEDYNDKLSITKFLISMINLNKNFKKIGEKKVERSYELDSVDFEKDIINPVIFLDEMYIPKIEDPHMSTFNLLKSLKIVSSIHQKIKVNYKFFSIN